MEKTEEKAIFDRVTENLDLYKKSSADRSSRGAERNGKESICDIYGKYEELALKRAAEQRERFGL